MSKKEFKEPKDLMDYIEGYAKLYAERETTSNEEDKALVNKKIADYKEQFGNRQASYSSLDEAYINLVAWFTGDSNNVVRATESKFAILLRLLKQTGIISNKDYESAVKQFRAINRDYKIKVVKDNG